MEQQLINALMKLFSKAGGGSLIKDLIQQTDQNGNPKVWTSTEISAALDFVNWQTENFGTPEATVMIDTLRKKYNLGSASTESSDEGDVQLPTLPGVHGLK